MKWLKAKRFYLRPRRLRKRDRTCIPDPMRSYKAPYFYQYPVSYDTPYADGGSVGFGYGSDGGQPGISMYPEHNVGLGLGRANER